MSEWRVPFNNQAEIRLLNALKSADSRERSVRSKSGFLELMVDRFKDVKIEIFSNEHPPPHFHVQTNVGSAIFTIKDCTLIRGVPLLRRRMREIRNWHVQHKQDLIKCWNETRPSDCPVGEYEE